MTPARRFAPLICLVALLLGARAEAQSSSLLALGSGESTSSASVLATPAPWIAAMPVTANDAVATLLLDPPSGTPLLAARGLSGGSKSKRAGRPAPILNAERARILLRSLTIPGWGQATLGHRKAAGIFGLTEASVWGAFLAFHVQEQLRTESFLRTAELRAGIDLDGRGEQIRRIVGLYASSDEYNQLVVYRDAASQFYDDPVKYREYIAAHELKGKDTWEWDSEDSFFRYRGQRKDAQRANQRANTALALAIANRLVSAVHAARSANHAAPKPQSWNLECVPVPGADATAFHLGVRAHF